MLSRRTTTALPQASLEVIEYVLPDVVVTNDALAREFPEWSVEKIRAKTGIDSRRIVAEGELASDLGCRAAEALLSARPMLRSEIDYLLFCSQSLDYPLPTTACLMQSRLGLSTATGAIDLPLGCSGFVYGLGLAKGLIETGQARNILLITAETYSRYIHAADRSVRTIFGDAGAASLITANGSVDCETLGPFVYGTDGRGAGNLIVRPAGSRSPVAHSGEPAQELSEPSSVPCGFLHMNGSEVLTFTLQSVPVAIKMLLARSERSLEDIDLFVFHQANEFMLNRLRDKVGIPAEKFFVFLASCGNTVSCSIPIALREAEKAGRLRFGNTVMLVGFGVGYSWAATLLRWMPTETNFLGERACSV